jgi:uncharacterized membrane protein YfcA
VPSQPVALLLLGLTPFLIRLAPRSHRPNPESLPHGMVCGIVCMMLILLTGVAGPLVDTFFLGGKLDRREIVATKAICQVFGHAAKILYFGVLIDQAPSIDPVISILAVVCSMIGTTLAAKVLLIITDQQYRSWANRIITAVAGYYVVYGTILVFLTPLSAQ